VKPILVALALLGILGCDGGHSFDIERDLGGQTSTYHFVKGTGTGAAGTGSPADAYVAVTYEPATRRVVATLSRGIRIEILGSVVSSREFMPTEAVGDARSNGFADDPTSDVTVTTPGTFAEDGSTLTIDVVLHLQGGPPSAAPLDIRLHGTGTLVPPASGMVFVRAGEFTMGSNDTDPTCSGCFADEQPIHTVTLSSYSIDQNDVTVDDYAACVSASSCSPADGPHAEFPACNAGAPDRGDHPINCVDWNQAEVYCTWVGKRLPTEAEWEKAARGSDARTYPWGEATPTCDYAVMDDPKGGGLGCGRGTTGPAGSKPAGKSPYGALDMAGNVYDWVNDWYDPKYYSVSPSTNPPGPASGTKKVQRGGSWLNYYHVRSAYRGVIVGRLPWDDGVGFRCARDE